MKYKFPIYIINCPQCHKEYGVYQDDDVVRIRCLSGCGYIEFDPRPSNLSFTGLSIYDKALPEKEIRQHYDSSWKSYQEIKRKLEAKKEQYEFLVGKNPLDGKDEIPPQQVYGKSPIMSLFDELDSSPLEEAMKAKRERWNKSCLATKRGYYEDEPMKIEVKQ